MKRPAKPGPRHCNQRRHPDWLWSGTVPIWFVKRIPIRTTMSVAIRPLQLPATAAGALGIGMLLGLSRKSRR
jgi:hypothetical protein